MPQIIKTIRCTHGSHSWKKQQQYYFVDKNIRNVIYLALRLFLLFYALFCYALFSASHQIVVLCCEQFQSLHWIWSGRKACYCINEFTTKSIYAFGYLCVSLNVTEDVGNIMIRDYFKIATTKKYTRKWYFKPSSSHFKGSWLAFWSNNQLWNRFGYPKHCSNKPFTLHFWYNIQRITSFIIRHFQQRDSYTFLFSMLRVREKKRKKTEQTLSKTYLHKVLNAFQQHAVHNELCVCLRCGSLKKRKTNHFQLS